MLQKALKRWVAVIDQFSIATSIRQDFLQVFSESDCIQMVSDIFSGRAPATLMKRVRSIQKLVQLLKPNKTFPPDESTFYSILCRERQAGAPATRLKSHFEQLQSVTKSRRCMGATRSDAIGPVRQASPLTVGELKHAV